MNAAAAQALKRRHPDRAEEHSVRPGICAPSGAASGNDTDWGEGCRAETNCYRKAAA
jgi:hypothetical protein